MTSHRADGEESGYLVVSQRCLKGQLTHKHTHTHTLLDIPSADIIWYLTDGLMDNGAFTETHDIHHALHFVSELYTSRHTQVRY